MLFPFRNTWPEIELFIGTNDPSRKGPLASGLYKVVTRNSPLSESGSNKADTSQCIILKRFVESALTTCRRSNLEVTLLVICKSNRRRSRSCRNMFFIQVTLNRDSGDVTEILDYL